MPAAALWRAPLSTCPRRAGSAGMADFYWNVFSDVPAKVRDVSHMLKAIHAQENRVAADQKARAIIEDFFGPAR